MLHIYIYIYIYDISSLRVNLLHIPNTERVMWVDATKFLNDKTKGCLAVQVIYIF